MNMSESREIPRREKLEKLLRSYGLSDLSSLDYAKWPGCKQLQQIRQYHHLIHLCVVTAHTRLKWPQLPRFQKWCQVPEWDLDRKIGNLLHSEQGLLEMQVQY
eukprot:s4252_g7.t1